MFQCQQRTVNVRTQRHFIVKRQLLRTDQAPLQRSSGEADLASTKLI
jgi:hypothetical protein